MYISHSELLLALNFAYQSQNAAINDPPIAIKIQILSLEYQTLSIYPYLLSLEFFNNKKSRDVKLSSKNERIVEKFMYFFSPSLIFSLFGILQVIIPS